MLVLVDENLPIALWRLLTGCEARTVEYQCWKGIVNGDLLDAAESAGFSVLLTGDKTLRYEQTLPGRGIAVVILSDKQMGRIRFRRASGVNVALPGPGAF